MAKRGRPRKAVNPEESWVPVTNSYKYKESVADKTLEKIKRERLIEGYKKLHKAAFDTRIKDNDMKPIHKLIRELGF